MSPTSSEIIDHYTVMGERERLAPGIGFAGNGANAGADPAPSAAAGCRRGCGGGPGAYAGWLSSLGYDIQLIEAVEKHVAQARELALASSEVGDARHLPQADASADAVLLLGPLYHLTERGDLAALREAGRVVRPGGFVFAEAITCYASLLASLSRGFIDDPEFTPHSRTRSG